VARKPSGEIGITKITATQDGQRAELLSVDLPEDKEGLEKYFADRFVSQLNRDGTLEDKIVIESQNDTTDLDFNITGSPAKYLELAEIAPYSEDVGKSALEGQWISVYDFSKWIWRQLIEKKQSRYGDVSKDTILLLYTARWEFFISQSVLHSLIWTLQNKGCCFHAVYLMQAGGEDLNLVYCLYPNNYPADHPRKFRENRYLNGKPGTDQLKLPNQE
jgi:hypothetical protein